ncbi:MAG: hypothetical protein U5N26_09190 [Candidatus Marinimicrobia bacterium]|nr:hypothetical protein [Candidatus Neomarinimicrobiota bacterium]
MSASLQDQENWNVPRGNINVWWNDASNTQLSLLMAFLLKQNREWRDKKIRILRPVAPRADMENIRAEMLEMLKLSRIEAEIILLPGNEPLAAVRENLGVSAVLFAGFDPEEEEGSAARQLKELEKVMQLPGDIILVHNAGEVSPLD